MKKLLVLGIFAGALAIAAPARAGVYLSVNLGVPILSVQVGLAGVHVQAGPVAVGVGLAVPAADAPPVVNAPAPVVDAAPPAGVKPVRVPAPRPGVAPPPLTVYAGPYPSHIAPPFSP